MNGGERTYYVYFQVMKGLGPDFFEKVITVFFDDIDPESNEQQLRQWAINQATAEIKRAVDITHFCFVDILDA
jgi:hypothetical protein